MYVDTFARVLNVVPLGVFVGFFGVGCVDFSFFLPPQPQTHVRMLLRFASEN